MWSGSRAEFGVRVYQGNDDDPGGGFAFVDDDGSLGAAIDEGLSVVSAGPALTEGDALA